MVTKWNQFLDELGEEPFNDEDVKITSPKTNFI